MSRPDRVNPDPNGKGENWPKFLKEMQVLGPALQSRLGPVAPGNRAAARGAGFANVEEYLRKETDRLVAQQKFRDYTVNKWFDDAMKRTTPWAMRLIAWLQPRVGRRAALILRLLGYKLRADDGLESGVPFTLCTISRFGRLRVGQRFFWEDPAKANIPHKRKDGQP